MQDKPAAADPLTDASDASYTVQEAAALTDLSEHTLRYYERAGLMPGVVRQGSGRHRRYQAHHLQFLVFLRRMRATGMPIHVLKRYVELVVQGDSTLAERRHILESHRDAVCAHIAELQDCLGVIDFKLAHYEETARPAGTRLPAPEPKH